MSLASIDAAPLQIVCFGQQNWDFCWTGKQHLATRLAARGHRVLYVDPDLDLEGARGVEAIRTLAPLETGLGLREVAPRLFVFTHHYSPLLRWRASVWRHPRLVQSWARRLGLSDPIALTLHPLAGRHLEVLKPRVRVHYAIDEMTGYGGLPESLKRRIRREEHELVRRSHVSLAISPRLASRLAKVQPHTYLLPSGADVEHFSPERLADLEVAPDLEPVRGTSIIGFIGQIDERIDQDLLAEVARARPNWSLVLIGRVKQGVDVSRLAERSNVYLIGYRPFSELPRFLKAIDVCIVPYRKNELTHSCSPLKVYEYLAAGRPVVATSLEGLGPCANVVDLADTPADFLRAIDRNLAAPGVGREARLATAAAHSWDRRVDELERRLREARRRSAAAGTEALPSHHGVAIRERAERAARPALHAVPDRVAERRNQLG